MPVDWMGPVSHCSLLDNRRSRLGATFRAQQSRDRGRTRDCSRASRRIRETRKDSAGRNRTCPVRLARLRVRAGIGADRIAPPLRIAVRMRDLRCSESLPDCLPAVAMSFCNQTLKKRVPTPPRVPGSWESSSAHRRPESSPGSSPQSRVHQAGDRDEVCVWLAAYGPSDLKAIAEGTHRPRADAGWPELSYFSRALFDQNGLNPVPEPSGLTPRPLFNDNA